MSYSIKSPLITAMSSNEENSYVFLSMNMGCLEYEYFLSFTYRIPMQCVDTEIDVMAVALARNHQLFVNNANVARPFRTLPQIHTHTKTLRHSMHTDTKCYQWGCRHLLLLMLTAAVHTFISRAIPLPVLGPGNLCFDFDTVIVSVIIIPHCLRFHFQWGFCSLC